MNGMNISLNIFYTYAPGDGEMGEPGKSWCENARKPLDKRVKTSDIILNTNT